MKLHLYAVAILLFFCFSKCQPQTPKTIAETKPSSAYTYDKPSEDGTGKFYFGREIAHVMGAAGAAWLEERVASRKKTLHWRLKK